MITKTEPQVLRGKQNPFFFRDERLNVSRKQVELAFLIRQFRRINNLSQDEMAKLCTFYGKHAKIKFNVSDISSYENYNHAPTPPKFQILMNTMGVDPDTL